MNYNFKLSLLLPSIRRENLVKCYESILGATKQSFELVIVSPYQLPAQLEKYKNIKLITSKAHPTACFNIALQMAEGEYITWFSDDGVWTEGVLDEVLSLLEGNNNRIVSMSCQEGSGIYSDQHLTIRNSPNVASPFIPNHYKCVILGMMRRELLEKVGGLRNCFGHHSMAHVCMSIELQLLGAEVVFLDKRCLICSHIPGPNLDHRAVHHQQVDYDEPLFKAMFMTTKEEFDKNINNKTTLDSWKHCDQLWGLRFDKEGNRTH